MTNTKNANILFASAIILIAVVTRLIPHLPNFSPVLAIALFSGFFISNKRLAVLIPLTIMLLSDIIIGFHQSMLAVYLCFFLMVLVGFRLSDKINFTKAILATFAGSIVFFLVTNFYFWLFSGMYTMNYAGLVDCYVRAIPFYRNSILGDLAYMGVLYGSYQLFHRYVTSLSSAKIPVK